MHIYLIKLPSTLIGEKAGIETKEKDIIIKNIVSPDKIEGNVFIDTNFHKDRYGFPLSNSEILNFVTHQKAWSLFLNTDEPKCLILEDNVNTHIDLQEINSSIMELSDDWDLFFPYDPIKCRQKDIKIDNRAKLLVNPNIREMREWEPYVLGYQWGNSIYFVSRRGAEKLLAINTIRQRLDDEIITMAGFEKLNVFTGEVEWFDYKQIKPVLFDDRRQLIWNTVCANSTWTPSRKERVRYLLKEMSDTANNLNIDLVLQGGTHLGYIRHRGIIPWDDDVDVGIEEENLSTYLEQVNKVEGIRYGEFIEPQTRVPFYKIWHKDGEIIENHTYTFPFIDLWLYNRIGNDLVFKNGIICPESAACDLVEVIFEGLPFKIPFNSIEILDTRYKDWKKKIRVYTWCHRYEKSKFIPFTLDIEVDAEGRLVTKFDSF